MIHQLGNDVMTKEPQGATDLVEAQTKARNLQRVRKARQTELAEDYVELVAELVAHHGSARASDLALRLGVSNATVSNAVQRLVRAGLIEDRPYDALKLTRSGEALAQASLTRHKLVREMLVLMGVPPDIAEADAEGIEHHVSAETLAVFQRCVTEGRIIHESE